MPLSATECLPHQVAEARAEAEAARAEALSSVTGYRAPPPLAPAAPASDPGGAPAQPLTLAALRAQLVSAVQKEVAARGAAQERAELLREQQTKLSILAEGRRQAQAEAAAAREQAGADVRAALERQRQVEAQHASDLGASRAMATREQLKAAQAAQELEQALEAAARDKEALATAHREELRVKELILADLSSQLVQARQALSTAQEGAKGASAARDAAERETAACREAREALRASEAKRERLETALEELEAARAEATADAEHAWQQVTHFEGMLKCMLRATDCL